MKNKILYAVLLVYLLLPTIIYVDRIKLVCPDSVAPQAEFTCKIIGETETMVSGISAHVSISDALKLNAVLIADKWQGAGEKGDISIFIDPEVKGSFDIGTLKLKNISTIGVFKNSISTNATLKVFNSSNVEQDNNAALATGHLFKVSFPSHNIDYKISILGDVIGNGTVTIDDAKRIALHIIDGNVINGDEYLMAADFDGNNIIKMNDAIRLLKSIQN